MLILIAKGKMQALEREIINNHWMTIVLVFALVLLVVLKALNSEKLRGYAFALFNKGFVSLESEENTTFTTFNSLLFFFTNIVISLLIYILANDYFNDYFPEPLSGFTAFITIFLLVFGYFIVKWLLEFLVAHVFLIKNQTRHFLFSKSSYLYSISFGVFILLILYRYTYSNSEILLIVSLSLAIMRLFIFLINNKNLIIGRLFYFILYLCTFEIAPLFLLSKLIF